LELAFLLEEVELVLLLVVVQPLVVAALELAFLLEEVELVFLLVVVQPLVVVMV
jgi:hypothetical protein